MTIALPWKAQCVQVLIIATFIDNGLANFMMIQHYRGKQQHRAQYYNACEHLLIISMVTAIYHR